MIENETDIAQGRSVVSHGERLDRRCTDATGRDKLGEWLNFPGKDRMRVLRSSR
jgi:hypothetical protein